MADFFRMIRYQNLLLLAGMQLVFRYGFLELQAITPALADWQYAILVLATVSIAAAGYLINDIHDQETDRINKPDSVFVGKAMSEKAAYNWYFALNIIGVGAGFYLSNLIGRPEFSAIFISIAALLHLYATNFKQSPLFGNFLVAILLATSVIIIGVYDLFPILSNENRPLLSVLFQVLIDYAVFAFMINLLREIVKDLEDVDGDYNQGMNTLPIALGVARTSKAVFWISMIPNAVLAFYVNKFFIANNLWIAAAYSLVLVIAPMIYFTIKMWQATTKKEFHHLANVLKFVILFGILSILVISLNIKYNG